MQNSNKFYFVDLPKFVDILKEKLIVQVDKNNNLTIEDYIKVFFDFYCVNNANDYFKSYNAKEHEMYLSLSLKSESQIHMERSFWIEGVDEQYQIIFKLYLDILPIKNDSIDFEIQRDKYGKFFHWEKGYFDFEDYQAKVLNSEKLSSYLKLSPKSMSIEVNADI